MGRKPRQEPRKEYLENARTSFLFSTPAEYRECFGKMSEKYLTPATKGTRLGKKTFRVVVHLPNKHHNDRDNYLAKMKGNWIDRTFLDSNAPIPASRIRWDSPANPGVHLIMHTERGKRVEFFLTPSGTYPKGTMVNGQITFPTMMRNKHTYKNGKSVWRRSEKLVACPVQLGFFGVSASKKGEFKLTYQKPVADCPKGLTDAGHSPPQFRRDWKPDDSPIATSTGSKVVAEAEGTLTHMAEEHYRAFYEAQNMNYDNLLEIQDVEIMDSETEQQGIERAYYNPSEAMVGTDETLDGYRPIDSATVDLTSNQPTANYGAEGEVCLACNGANKDPETHAYCENCRVKCVVCGELLDEDTDGENYENEICGTLQCYEEAGIIPEWMRNSYYAKDYLKEFPAEVLEKYGYSAEGETATYAPSNEPDMVSSSSFDEPTNSTFNADGSCGCGGCSCMAAEGEPVAVAEGDSLNGYAPIDSIEEGAPIGHGVNQYFGSAEGEEEALMDESTTDIGVEEGTSLEGFSGVDSVVVEAPLGHGVTQWYAETDGPQPPEPEGITGQDGPSADPTNAHMVLSAEGFKAYHASGSKRTGFVFPKRKAWPIGNKKHAIKALNYMKGGFGDRAEYPKIRKAIKKKYGSLNLASEHHKGQGYDDEMDESLGMRHRGGHKQSFRDRRDEASAMDKKGRRGRKYDDVMAMDASGTIVDWRDSKGRFKGGSSAHDSRGRFLTTKHADTAGYLQDGSLSMSGYTPLESVEVDRSSYQPTQNYGAEYEGEGFETFKTGAYFGTGWMVGVALLTAATVAGFGLVGIIMNE